MLVRKSVYLFGVLMTHFNQKYMKLPRASITIGYKFAVLFKGFFGSPFKFDL